MEGQPDNLQTRAPIHLAMSHLSPFILNKGRVGFFIFVALENRLQWGCDSGVHTQIRLLSRFLSTLPFFLGLI